jgi:hypothetical protein
MASTPSIHRDNNPPNGEVDSKNLPMLAMAAG